LLHGVSARTLTRQLRELEDCGVITRYIHQQISPRVEYSLTPFGRKLKPILDVMHDWGVEFEKAKLRSGK